MKSKTSAVVTAAGSLPTKAKNTFSVGGCTHPGAIALPLKPTATTSLRPRRE